MSTWLVALLSAVVAGVLGLLVPYAVRRLPEPSPESLGDVPEEEGPKELYADLGRLRGLGPAAAVVSAVVAAAFGMRLAGHDARTLWALVPLLPVLVLLAVVDWRTRLLPRIVVLPTTGVLLVLLLLEGMLTGETHLLVRAVIAMLLARSFFWVLWFVKRAGMGFGDVRLAALVGLVLGRFGWDAWLLGLYGGLAVFALWGVGRALVKRSRTALRQALPYGPFMILGLVLGVLAGSSVTLVG